MLTVDRINLYRNKKLILNNFSLTLGQGEIGAIMGENGSGKTSLLYSIAGFVSPDSGAICFGDEVFSTQTWTLPPEKRGVGMVFQDYALFPHLSVHKNILFGATSQSPQLLAKNQKEVIELTQIDHLTHKYPHELSGGEQQRVALARTLMSQARLMLFDEPFANLDVNLKRSLSFGVRHFLKKRNISALVASHDAVETLNICDKLGVLRHGKMGIWRDKSALSLDPIDIFSYNEEQKSS